MSEMGGATPAHWPVSDRQGQSATGSSGGGVWPRGLFGVYKGRPEPSLSITQSLLFPAACALSHTHSVVLLSSFSTLSVFSIPFDLLKIIMQPLFRPMEGHQLHHFANFHHLNHHHEAMAAAAAAAAARMNSTPVSDEELDMDDSVSLSSNQDGSCTSPQLSSSSAPKATGNLNIFASNFLENLKIKTLFFHL